MGLHRGKSAIRGGRIWKNRSMTLPPMRCSESQRGLGVKSRNIEEIISIYLTEYDT